MAKRRPMKLAVAANVLELAYGKEVFENGKLYAVAESDEEDEVLRRAAQRVLAAWTLLTAPGITGASRWCAKTSRVRTTGGYCRVSRWHPWIAF